MSLGFILAHMFTHAHNYSQCLSKVNIEGHILSLQLVHAYGTVTKPAQQFAHAVQILPCLRL